MAWEKSKAFLEKVQISSIVLYLVCLGGYAIPVDALHETYDAVRADIFWLRFFLALHSLDRPTHLRERRFARGAGKAVTKGGCSSVGRARALQA